MSFSVTLNEREKKMKGKIGKATIMIAVLLIGMALMANLSILNASETTFIRTDGSVESSIAQVEFDGNFVTQSSTDWWPMFRHDLRHTRYSTSKAPKTNYTVWMYTTGGWVGSSPAVVDGIVFVGSDDYHVYALDMTTGRQMWNFTTGNWTFSSPAVTKDAVFISSFDHNVYALNKTTGGLIWNYTTEGWITSSPAIADGVVFVGSYDNKTYALNETTGALIWSYKTGGRICSSPAIADRMVFIGSEDGKVYAFGTKSLYLLRHHHTAQFDAWDINPDGTATFQRAYRLSHATDPAGIAMDENLDTLFVTSEFSE